MIDGMRRREFITMVGGALAWPLAAHSQQTRGMRRIGMLSGLPPDDSVGQALLAAFRQQLSARGWSEGGGLSIEVRWGANSPERLREHAAELVRMKSDVIVVHGSRALAAVRRQTDRIPIVFASVSDPVASGYVASLARPGGNVTGFATYSGSPVPKLLEALKVVAPNTERVAFVISPTNLAFAEQLKMLESVAPSFAVKVTAMPIRDPKMIERTLAEFAKEPNGGLVVTSDVFMITHRDLIIAAAARYRLPAAYQDRSFVAAGGLISYSVDRTEQYRRAATYVDRILKGENPAELPVQQPEKFESVLNMKTAKALGLDVSRRVLVRVDEIID